MSKTLRVAVLGLGTVGSGIIRILQDDPEMIARRAGCQFDIRYVVVRDRNLEFEMVKRGDLDFYVVNRAQMWVQELNFDKIQSGVLQKRKVWNHSPESIQGVAFNTRRAPYDDGRVRKALRYLFNRELMIEKGVLTADEVRRTVEAMDARSPAGGL